MAVKAKSDDYKRLADSLSAGEIDRFYIFHGEERYLLERSLGELRRLLCPDGLDGFNYKRFEVKDLPASELEEAIDSLPVFADRTLVEIHDFDIFKNDERPRLAEIFANLPDYICVVIIFDIIPYKPDRIKLNNDITKHADVIEFAIQEQDKLIKWIKRHFNNAGKSIGTADAEYMAFITGGSMTALHGEIGKTAAYAAGQSISRSEIDAVVTPVADAVAYKLTDALIKHESKNAMRILDELLGMQEPAHRLMYSISLKIRQLLAARVCAEGNHDKSALMEMCGIRHEFQARILMETARRTTLSSCREAVLSCAETAYELNSAPEPEARLTELIAKLALI